jgi:hypothetical protein
MNNHNSAAGGKSQTFELASGRLVVTTHRSDQPFGELCAVASRLNAKRPYLFVSKVLGKHWPCAPRVMAETHLALARKLGSQPNPILFLAMAETAIGLGRGVFDSWLDLTCASECEALFSQTTRYNLGRKIALKIDEPHSHARDHLVYEPEGEEAQQIFAQAQTLVLVDDEISTGRTLLNLAQAYAAKNTNLQKIILVCLTNWLSESAREALIDLAPKTVKVMEFVSLLDGEFEFQKLGKPAASTLVRSVGDFSLKSNLLANYGRLGLTPQMAKALAQKAQRAAQELSFQPAQVRVVGTGEFLHEPFVLAKTLEQEGIKTIFQSTTRTPIALGGAIGGYWRFADNYGDGIDNFLYNPDPDFSGTTFLALETGSVPELIKLLKAQVIRL